MEKKKFTKKYALTGILVLCYLILCYTSVQAQVMTQQFPREKLLIRLNHIGTLYNKNIVFDTKQVANIEVPALNINNFTIEQALSATLQTTGLSYKKIAEQSYLIEKTAQTKPQSSPPGKASLRGRVVESETSEPLPGAAVQIPGTQLGTVTNINGYYTLANVPTGKVNLQISYVGFNTEKMILTLRNGETFQQDIKLSAGIALSEVQVRGVLRTRSAVPHTSEKLMVAEIKGLNVLASGISSEQISKTADRNAAQAVQKVSGVTVVDDKFVIVRGLNPRYNLTYLNDNTAPSTEANSRAFALDLIPSRIIDKIIVQKSPSPENQGDATGGVVKIYTKDAKAVRHLDIDFQLGVRSGTTFNSNFLTYNGGKTDFLGFDDGTRALPSVLPAYGSLDKAKLTPSQYAKAFNKTLYYGKNTALPNMQFTINNYSAFLLFGKTLSSLTSLSYKNDNQKLGIYKQEGTPERSSFQNTDKTSNTDRNTNTVQLNLLQNFRLSLNEHNTLMFKNFLLQQGIDNTVVNRNHSTSINTTSVDGVINKDITLSYNQRFLYAGNLGGNHSFLKEKHSLKWNLGYSFSRQETPDQRVIRLSGIRPDMSVGDASIQYWARGYNPSSSDDLNTVPLSLGIISRLWSRNSEGVYNGSVDYNFKALEWLNLKAGTFQQWKKRVLARRIYTVHEGNVDPAFFGNNALQNNYTDANLTRFREVSLPEVWSDSYLNDAKTGLYVLDRTSGSDTYLGTEQNNSGYLALDMTPWKWLELHGGMRYEYNRQKIAAALPAGDYDGINHPILVDHPMSAWLPSINVSIKPSEQWVVRMGYGKTVNRTEFREVSPFKELDFENNVILQGSTNLISARVTNYDFRMEWYPKGDKGDIVSLGAFYKNIDHPIERINNSNRVEGMFPVISYRNATSATVKGVELEVRKSFDFIPGSFFRNLSMSGNASLINSKAHFGDVYLTDFIIAERPLQGQAPYILNAGLYYDNANWGTKMAVIYNYVGQSIYAAGMGLKTTAYGPEYRGSLIELPRNLVDFSYTQRIVKSVQIKFTIQNLLDQKMEMVEDYNFTNKYEKLTTTKDGTQEGDNIASSFRPGRYFSLSCSYSF